METRKDVLKEFLRALLHIPQLLRRLAFKTRTLEQELHAAMLRGNLRKSFGPVGLLMLGLGVVIGTGAFTLTGQALADYAGSAVFLSYLITGIASACAAASYAELSVEYPISGGAFTYVMVTFGELPAFITLSMVLLEYGAGAAAVARGFSRYLALLCNQSPSIFLIPLGSSGGFLDYMACAVVLVLTLALSFGTRESATIMTMATLLKLAMLLALVIVGFTQASGQTFVEDFTIPGLGADGVFQGAAFVFFAYSAFDAVCNAAEEAQNIAHVPLAIMGTVGISCFVYTLMALALAMMVTPEQLSACGTSTGDPVLDVYDPSGAYAPPPHSPDMPNNNACPAGQFKNYQLAFAYAFSVNGLPGMQYFVALTALLGIITSLLVSLYSVARLVMVAARDWLLPPPLAAVSQRTQTPVLAQCTLGVMIAVLALLGSFVELSEVVSFGTLFAMWLVSNVMLVRRFYPDVKVRFTRYGTVEATVSAALRRVPGAKLSMHARRYLVVGHLLLINTLAIAFAAFYRASLSPTPVEDMSVSAHTRGEGIALYSLIAAWFLATCSMVLWCPLEYEPVTWRIPALLLPWMPSFAILLISFSVASLQTEVFKIMAIYTASVLVFYVLYALPMSYLKHFKLDADSAEQFSVVELVYQDGQWTSVNDLTSIGVHTPAASTMVEISGLSSIRRYGLAPIGKVSGGTYGSVSAYGSSTDGEPSGKSDVRSGDESSGGEGGSPVRRSTSAPRPTSRLAPLPSLREEGEEPGANGVDESLPDTT